MEKTKLITATYVGITTIKEYVKLPTKPHQKSTQTKKTTAAKVGKTQFRSDVSEKVRSEHLEQSLFVSWMKKTYPQHRIFAIPNGGVRSASAGAHLKLEGVSKGIPDICIPSLFLFIEMKRTKGGIVSKEQKDWIKYLNENGYLAVVCNGFDEAIQLIQNLHKA